VLLNPGMNLPHADTFQVQRSKSFKKIPNFVMQTPLNFRIATQADVQAVIHVYLASRKEFVPFAPLAHSDGDIHQWIQQNLIPTGRVTVVEEDRKVIGMMALSADETAGWIDHLYLHPNAVGRGIGSKLIEQAKASLGSPIRLYTFQQNVKAIKFYEHHGFKAIAYSDGSGNEENCPDILYEWSP
jgi:ribosomal protein S18 acetylase RimI-like enzyme